MFGMFLSALLFLSALFLILLVLVQRGRGGGLAGAFGGMGGQSAFGAKAGDVFTKATCVVAFCWILISVALLKYYAGSQDGFDATLGANAPAQTEQISPAATPSDGGTTDGSTPATDGQGGSGAVGATSPDGGADAATESESTPPAGDAP